LRKVSSVVLRGIAFEHSTRAFILQTRRQRRLRRRRRA
jgi:hypothetical protein